MMYITIRNDEVHNVKQKNTHHPYLTKNKITILITKNKIPPTNEALLKGVNIINKEGSVNEKDLKPLFDKIGK